MTPHSTHLSSMRPSYHHLTVQTVDGSPLSVTRQGTLCSGSFYVPDISLVLNLAMQLMSVGQITDHDCYIIFDPDFCYIQDHRTGHLVGTSPRCHDSQRLCEFDWLRLTSTAPASPAATATASSTSSFSQWHHRLGHLCASRLSALLRRGLLGSVLG
jgi:hypothetical protein